MLGAEDAVALHVDGFLFLPMGPGVGGGGDHAHAVGGGGLGDGAAEHADLFAGLADGGADAGADLDLGLEEFVGDLVAEDLLAMRHEAGGLPGGERPGLRVHEEVFLLDSDGKGLFLDAHLVPRLDA